MIADIDVIKFLSKNNLQTVLGYLTSQLKLNEIMSSIAKTDYKTINEHNKDIINFLQKNVLPFKSFAIAKYCNYFNITLNDFFTDLIFIVIMHDYGKSNKLWQNFIKKIIKGEQVRSSHIRHEFDSFCEIVENYKKIRKFDSYHEIFHIFIPIFAHHGNLNENFIVNYNYDGNFPKLPDNKDVINEQPFLTELKKITHKLLRSNYIDLWYRQQIFRYLLSNGDKKASAIDVKIPINELLKFNDKYAGNYRPFQSEILNKADKDILLVRVKTGGGKTFGAIRWGVEQLINKKAERIVFAMPTQFTSNSITNDITEFISNTTTYHSSVKNNINNDYDRYFYLKFCQNLESIVNVVTIDQLLYAITLSNEDYKVSSFNLINSCLIIDEMDFYDSFTIANIIKLIKFCKYFKVKMLIMSATLPNKFVQIIENEIEQKIDLIDFSVNDNKKRIDIKSIKPWDDDIINQISNSNDAIVYCNTVNNAISIYEKIKEKRDDVIVYHSKMLIEDKLKQEQQIISMLGKQSWENNTNKGIVIMTQIGELSINISSSNIFTEIAPMDRLVQRFGRGCRFEDDKICNVYVLLPINTITNQILFAPYLTKSKDNQIVPNDAILKTLDILKCTQYSYMEYIEIINKIYESFDIDYVSTFNSNKIIEMFKQNILMNFCKDYESLDDSNVNQSDWKCRNIEPSMRIFINDEQFLERDRFNSIDELYFLMEKYSLSIPIREFKSIKKIIIERKIFVNEREITLHILPSEYYKNEENNVKGLNIKQLSEYYRSTAVFM